MASWFCSRNDFLGQFQRESGNQLCKLVASGILGNSCTGMWPMASRSKAWGIATLWTQGLPPLWRSWSECALHRLIGNEVSKFAYCCILRSFPLDYLHWKTTFSVANRILPLPQFIGIRIFVGGARKSLLQIGYLYTNNLGAISQWV